MKYIIKYTNPNNNKVEYYEVNSIEEFAMRYLFFNIEQNERGGWDIYLLGEEVAHYTNEWSRAEAMKDYFRNFTQKNNWKNIEYYTKI